MTLLPTRSSALCASLAAAGAIAVSPAVRAAPQAPWYEAAQRAEPAVIETLKTLVLIETGSGDVQGLAQMAQLLEARLQALGFTTEKRKSTAGAGADTVVGMLAGTGRRKVMLQAHMDTVYRSGILQTQPYKQEGNKLFGPGIADDKGGIAVILHALGILANAGWKDYASLTVLFNPDEEVGSIGSGELIATLAEGQDVVMSFEPTGARAVFQTESLLLGAAGTASVTMQVKGRASHAGASPELGRNAIIEIAHKMLETRDIARDIPGAQLNWTNVVSNKATNQIPELAIAVADVRMTVPGAEKPLDAALQARVRAGRLVPDTETTVKLTVGRPAFVANAAGRALAQRAQAIYQELDRPLGLVPMTGAATDAGFAGRSGRAAVVESFGLAGFGYHARDEYIEIDSIVPRLYLATRLLVEIGRQ